MVGGVDLEVVGLEIQRHARAPAQRVPQRAPEVEGERVAEPIRTGLLGAELNGAAVVGGVAAGAVLEQPLVDVAQRELPDRPHTLGRQSELALARRQVARVGEQHPHALQELEVAERVRPEQRPQRLQVDGLDVPGQQALLELSPAVHLPHQLDGLWEGE